MKDFKFESFEEIEESNRKKMEVISDTAKKFKSETIQAIYLLNLQMKFLKTPKRDGTFGIGDLCKVTVSRSVAKDLAENFDVVKPIYTMNEIKPFHFPYTGGEFLRITWNFKSYRDIMYLFEMFLNLDFSQDILWLTDYYQKGIKRRIEKPRSKFKCFFEETEEADKEFNEYTEKNFPSKIASSYYLEVLIGKLKNTNRESRFQLTYTEDLAPHFLGGTLKLSFNYQVTVDGELTNRVKGKEIESDLEKEDIQNNLNQNENNVIQRNFAQKEKPKKSSIKKRKKVIRIVNGSTRIEEESSSDEDPSSEDHPEWNNINEY